MTTPQEPSRRWADMDDDDQDYPEPELTTQYVPPVEPQKPKEHMLNFSVEGADIKEPELKSLLSAINVVGMNFERNQCVVKFADQDAMAQARKLNKSQMPSGGELTVASYSRWAGRRRANNHQNSSGGSYGRQGTQEANSYDRSGRPDRGDRGGNQQHQKQSFGGFERSRTSPEFSSGLRRDQPTVPETSTNLKALASIIEQAVVQQETSETGGGKSSIFGEGKPRDVDSEKKKEAEVVPEIPRGPRSSPFGDAKPQDQVAYQKKKEEESKMRKMTDIHHDEGPTTGAAKLSWAEITKKNPSALNVGLTKNGEAADNREETEPVAKVHPLAFAFGSSPDLQKKQDHGQRRGGRGGRGRGDGVRREDKPQMKNLSSEGRDDPEKTPVSKEHRGGNKQRRGGRGGRGSRGGERSARGGGDN